MSAITHEQLRAVRKGLQPLQFDPHKDSTEKNPDETRYLDYYNLNFQKSFPNLKHYLGYFSVNNFHIASQYWVPGSSGSADGKPRGTVFIVHGYFDHVGLYSHLIGYFLQQNYTVVVFDLPGHGLSSGKRVNIETFDHYVDVFSKLLGLCGEHFPSPWHASGQSTGGAILLKYLLAANAENRTNPFESIALLAPLIHPRAWKFNLWFYRAVHRFVSKMKRKFVANTNDPKFNKFVATADPLQSNHIDVEWVGAMKRWTEEFAELPQCDFPVQVVQGDCDQTVDWQYNVKAIALKLPNAKIVHIEGARHHLVNEEKNLRTTIFESMGI